MLLKSLEIQGFKTFPDKTRLSFDRGITSVVGPNGSGKSNISDAIRWVLGEQSTKALRCSKMEDVVFKGTDTRKKTGYAEVTLTIENKDRILPYDDDEVSVTRRYYRSGESEYLINKTTVRLKDINELFMDTGLGRDGYSMISQGKIDSIVASKSEDRREIFEEAAGISRYRYRKAEAERRLKLTEENLCRLRDILSELELRVEPLKEQSQKAEKFLLYSKEKRGLEIALWLDTLEKSSGVLREQEDKLTCVKSEYNNVQKEIEEICTLSEEIFKSSCEKTASVDNIRKQLSDIAEALSRVNESIALTQNDIEHSEENIKRIKTELNSSHDTLKQLENTTKECDELEREKRIQIEESKNQYTLKIASLNSINEDALKSSDEISALNEKITQLNTRIADEKIREMSCVSSISEIKSRVEAVAISKKDGQEAIEKIDAYISDLRKMLISYDDELQGTANSLSGCRMLRDTKAQKLGKLKLDADKLMLDYQERIRRIKILEDMEKNLEGFAQSVKSVMREVSHGTLSGIIGPVSRIFSIKDEFSTAIEIALGASMQHIVTENEQHAKNAIAYLKRSDSGRATFLPLTNIKGKKLNEVGIDACEGFVGIASELCSYDKKYTDIICSLLGRTVIAEDINSATAIAKKYGYRFKLVTLDGQVVNAGGSLTGGSFGKKAGLLTRMAEIARNKELASKLKREEEEAASKCKAAQSELSSIEADILANEAELTKIREEKIKLEAELKSRESQLANSKRALANMLDEEKNSEKRISELEAERQVAVSSGIKLSEEVGALYEQIESITGKRDIFANKRDEINAELEKLRLELAVCEKEIDNIRFERENARLTLENYDKHRKELMEELSSVENVKSDKQAYIISLNEQAEKYHKEQNEFEEKINQLVNERAELEFQTTQLRKNERDKQAQRENLGKELARMEERKLNLQKRYDEIIARLWDQYELTRSEAEKEAFEIEDMHQANKRLSELKGKIKSLGSINVGAIEEYKEVSERYTFLNTQVEDVESSKRDIIKLIGDLTKQMSTLFIERFNEISKNFGETFRELFGGGKAHLELSNPEDVLNCGIEIICNPPGKIVEHLELLSGGEKALVAIAIYFAIMKVRPAPFCVMDEIEAALDEVNVYRFAAYLRRMNDKTQFILITHRRGTMEEADVLYGVTMQDEGISKLLELRASEVASKLGKLE